MKFSYKLALTISLSALLTFIVLDVSLIILYEFILRQQTVSTGYNINLFNQFSSDQIISTTRNNLITEVDIYEEIVTEIYLIYDKFVNSTGLYTSLQQKGINPKLTSTFTQQPIYNQSSVYFYTDQSTFYNEPYIDRALCVSISHNNPYYVQRLNVIYQTVANLQDIMIRTVPATSDFTVPSVQSVSSRFTGLSPGILSISTLYNDTFSKTNPNTLLVAIRALIPTPSTYRLLFQIQIQSLFINSTLNQIYSYASSGLALIYLPNQATTTQYTVLGQSDTMQPYYSILNFSEYLAPNNYNVSAVTQAGSQQSFLVTTIAIGNAKQFVAVNNSNVIVGTNLRMILVLNKTETDLANQSYEAYQQQEYSALLQFLLVWSFCMVFLLISIGYAMTDYLFSYFQYIRKKCQQYIKEPHTAENSYFEMKQIASQQNHNRVLLENMISIIQRIEAKKKMNQKKNITNKKNRKNTEIKNGKSNKNDDKNINKEQMNQKAAFDQYPLNFLSAEFQEQMNIRDWERFEAIAQQIQQKMKAAAAAAAAAKKQQQKPS